VCVPRSRPYEADCTSELCSSTSRRGSGTLCKISQKSDVLPFCSVPLVGSWLLRNVYLGCDWRENSKVCRTWHNSWHRATTHCTPLHPTAPHCHTLPHIATHCTRLQHTATHCNTLQHTATRTAALNVYLRCDRRRRISPYYWHEWLQADVFVWGLHIWYTAAGNKGTPCDSSMHNNNYVIMTTMNKEKNNL